MDRGQNATDINYARYGVYAYRYYDDFSWIYTCPIGDQETTDDAFRRVLNLIIDILPGFAQPTSFAIWDHDRQAIDVEDLPTEPAGWQQAIRDAIPPQTQPEAIIYFNPDIQDPDGRPINSFAGNHVAVDLRQPDLPGEIDTIEVSLSIYFSFYEPPPPEATPEHIQQTNYNRPRLTRFLTDLQTGLNARFTGRNDNSIGPYGILKPDAPQAGLPHW